MTQTALVTADELLAMGKDDRYELVEGVLVPMSPPPAMEHGHVAMMLALRAGSFVADHRLGWTFAAETGFRLHRDPDTVRGPDFAFVARGRITREMNLRRYLDVVPDLVAEVVSPSDSAAEVNAKVVEYLDAGVRLVWVLYPQSQTVALHRPGGESELLRAGDELSGEEVLPGFSCPVADLFATPEFP
jgi:Uma2 family endonuclease